MSVLVIACDVVKAFFEAEAEAEAELPRQ